MIVFPLIAGLLGLAIALAMIPPIIYFCSRSSLAHRAPDLHHTHRSSVPRLGGLALAAAFVGVEVAIALFIPEHRARTPGRNVIIFSSLAMFALGFWDDLRPLGAKWKLLAQILIAMAVWSSGIGVESFKVPLTENIINLHGWGAFFTVLWLVGMTNLINLIDGVDGLAGGICLMLMGLMAYVGHQNGNFELLASGMAGALVGFLWFNFPPARIYLGDGGAYFLGFQIGLFALINSQKGTILAALIAPLFVLALPILDTTLAIFRRGLRGLPVFRPDRRHIHHRLLGTGLSRRQVVLSIYSLTLVFLAFGLLAFWSQGKLVPVLMGVAVLILLVCAGKFNFSREWFAVGRVVGNSLEMRGEIQYALSLTRWLALEGGRCTSIEDIWSSLVFAAQKLGFTYVKLTLADGDRVWGNPEAGQPLRSARVEIHGGRSGVLDLRAPARAEEGDARSHDLPSDSAGQSLPSIQDGNVFEILSELLVEGWSKAANHWRNGNESLLRFDARVSIPSYRLKRNPLSWLVSATRTPPLTKD